MTTAYINRVATAVPGHEVHANFVRFAGQTLQNSTSRALFERMANRAQIERRWSCLAPPRGGVEVLDGEGFYKPGHFPSTADRMARYEIAAPALGTAAVERLGLDDNERKSITHLIVASCTGFSAPGVDLELLERCGLNSSVERTVIGFMGCHAAMNALKIAHHIVRSTPTANVLVVCLELCTLHFQETADLDRLLTFLLFGDGCAAALISAAPDGIALNSFHAELVQKAADQITWNIRDAGFDMVLSGRVPSTITGALRESSARVLGGKPMDAIDIWAVHPGGRSILDAVEGAFELEDSALAASRAVLRDYGNMSSATILFVLERLMRDKTKRGASGCALAFGPGLTAETMLFRMAA
ncbi:MAG: type III polyketide synthase [Methylovirgula sp.]|uniref:type III polyketide synthase n=1 Tax=Methylovirgula sp. TaxID=1978224 RepID=UPI0030761059